MEAAFDPRDNRSQETLPVLCLPISFVCISYSTQSGRNYLQELVVPPRFC